MPWASPSSLLFSGSFAASILSASTAGSPRGPHTDRGPLNPRRARSTIFDRRESRGFVADSWSPPNRRHSRSAGDAAACPFGGFPRPDSRSSGDRPDHPPRGAPCFPLRGRRSPRSPVRSAAGAAPPLTPLARGPPGSPASGPPPPSEPVMPPAALRFAAGRPRPPFLLRFPGGAGLHQL